MKTFKNHIMPYINLIRRLDMKYHCFIEHEDDITNYLKIKGYNISSIHVGSSDTIFFIIDNMIIGDFVSSANFRKMVDTVVLTISLDYQYTIHIDVYNLENTACPLVLNFCQTIEKNFLDMDDIDMLMMKTEFTMKPYEIQVVL